MAVTDSIVTVAATVTAAPQPSYLQASGACISVNATTAGITGGYVFYGTLADALADIGTTGNYVELTNELTAFFAQSSVTDSPVGVSILELGNQTTPAAAITALQTWITANPNIFYAYLTPATWDATTSAAMNTMASNFSSPTSKTYFFGTTTAAHLSAYTVTNKALFMTVPSPTAAGTEFQAAAPFYQWLVNNPSTATPLAPMAFRYLYGVTPWVKANNQTAINAILAAGGNIVLTGAEGGISTACLFKGTTIDKNQSMGWYDVDWVLINAKLRLANNIINGSNSDPPLVYNQAGINQLLATLTNLGKDSISFGIAQSISFGATSFTDYKAAHPSDYAAGIYNGFTCTMTSQLGFLSISFNLDAVQF